MYFPDPGSMFTQSEVEAANRVVWHRGAQATMTGRLFTDGSTHLGTCDNLRRCGWAVVEVDDDGGLISAAYGLVPLCEAPDQTSRDAEDFAILQAVQFSLPPLEVNIDCAGTLGCVSNLAAAVKPKRPRAHWWSQVAAAWLEEDVTGVKVKAHTTWKQVDEGVISAADKVANGHADRLAKKAAKLQSPPDSDSLLLVACQVIAAEAALWCGVNEVNLETAGARDSLEDEVQSELEVVLADGEVDDLWARPGDAGHDGPKVEELKPWRFNGHSVVEAEVEDEGNPVLIYCLACAAFCWQRASPKLLQPCAPCTEALRKQKERIANGWCPQHQSGCRIGVPRTPSAASRRAWGPKLGLAPEGGPANPDPPPRRVRYGHRAPQRLSRQEVLQAYGFNSEEEAIGVAKEALRANSFGKSCEAQEAYTVHNDEWGLGGAGSSSESE
jgi:hypothetical protein